jgi:hypothetical protein
VIAQQVQQQRVALRHALDEWADPLDGPGDVRLDLLREPLRQPLQVLIVGLGDRPEQVRVEVAR